MIHPVLAAFVAGLGTWAATALGASFVFLSGSWIKATMMDFIYGSSAGVMLAACFFSLLGPSVTLAKEAGWKPWLPSTLGFCLGVIFIKLADFLLPDNTAQSPWLRSCFGDLDVPHMEDELRNITSSSPPPSTPSSQLHSENNSDSESRGEHDLDSAIVSLDRDLENASSGSNSGPNTSLRPRREALSKSLLLLVLAITVHNIPEGIALGFAFGGLKSTGEAYQLSEAIMLAVALGLQNVPEGMAVSIPLHRSGMSKMKSFLLGQFSGSVEVLGAVLGAAFALLLTSVLPYCLSFAAGAMIYVVLSDLLPQSTQTTSRVGLWGCLAGFVLMMALDTGFS